MKEAGISQKITFLTLLILFGWGVAVQSGSENWVIETFSFFYLASSLWAFYLAFKGALFQKTAWAIFVAIVNGLFLTFGLLVCYVIWVFGKGGW